MLITLFTQIMIMIIRSPFFNPSKIHYNCKIYHKYKWYLNTNILILIMAFYNMPILSRI